MSKLNLKEMVALWVKITGVDPTEDNRSYSIYLDGRLSDYDVKKDERQNQGIFVL